MRRLAKSFWWMRLVSLATPMQSTSLLARHATLQMDTSPSSPPVAGSVMVSLFQRAMGTWRLVAGSRGGPRMRRSDHRRQRRQQPVTRHQAATARTAASITMTSTPRPATDHAALIEAMNRDPDDVLVKAISGRVQITGRRFARHCRKLASDIIAGPRRSSARRLPSGAHQGNRAASTGGSGGAGADRQDQVAQLAAMSLRFSKVACGCSRNALRYRPGSSDAWTLVTKRGDYDR